jgi:hypothetical protein
VADQNGFGEFQVRDERGDIAAIVLDRALLRPTGRLAVAAQVAGHDLMVFAELLELESPVFVAAQKPVHEHERRRAAPLADEVQG